MNGFKLNQADDGCSLLSCWIMDKLKLNVSLSPRVSTQINAEHGWWINGFCSDVLRFKKGAASSPSVQIQGKIWAENWNRLKTDSVRFTSVQKLFVRRTDETESSLVLHHNLEKSGNISLAQNNENWWQSVCNTTRRLDWADLLAARTKCVCMSAVKKNSVWGGRTGRRGSTGQHGGSRPSRPLWVVTQEFFFKVTQQSCESHMIRGVNWCEAVSERCRDEKRRADSRYFPGLSEFVFISEHYSDAASSVRIPDHFMNSFIDKQGCF